MLSKLENKVFGVLEARCLGSVARTRIREIPGSILVWRPVILTGDIIRTCAGDVTTKA
jgi:hypothetical protein